MTRKGPAREELQLEDKIHSILPTCSLFFRPYQWLQVKRCFALQGRVHSDKLSAVVGSASRHYAVTTWIIRWSPLLDSVPQKQQKDTKLLALNHQLISVERTCSSVVQHCHTDNHFFCSSTKLLSSRVPLFFFFLFLIFSFFTLAPFLFPTSVCLCVYLRHLLLTTNRSKMRLTLRATTRKEKSKLV